MLLLAGSPALSDSRFELLKTQLVSVDPALSLERAFLVYAVDAEGEPDREQLAKLLQPGTEMYPRGDELALDDLIVVAPRIGTISPWASKATNIAQNCGFPALAIPARMASRFRCRRPTPKRWSADC